MAQSRVSNTPTPPVPEGGTSFHDLRGLAGHLVENPVARAILDSVACDALILTQQRRLVAATGEVLEKLGLTSPERLRELRSGELFRCTPVQDDFSRSAQYWVSSTPLRLGSHDLLLFTFKDITEEKRREALDQVFLHDLLNLVGGLDSLAGRLREVQSHRIMRNAESGRLVTDSREVRPKEILDRLRTCFASCEAAGKSLEILDGPGEPFACDPVLLTRVLVNLVKNALEATPAGGRVKVWHERRENRRGFMVENPGVISAEVGGWAPTGPSCWASSSWAARWASRPMAVSAPGSSSGCPRTAPARCWTSARGARRTARPRKAPTPCWWWTIRRPCAGCWTACSARATGCSPPRTARPASPWPPSAGRT